MRLMRLQEVTETTGLSRPTIYKRMAKGEFPLSVPLGERAVAWVEDEIEAWILARVEERDERLCAHAELGGEDPNQE